MNIPRDYRSIINLFRAKPEEIQKYFEHFPELSTNFPWEVSLGYLFTRVEKAQIMTLYCGAVKLHRTNTELTNKNIQSKHIKRKAFLKLFENIFNKNINDSILINLREAEKVRDNVLHGKDVSDAKMREAVVRIFKFAEEFNNFMSRVGGFKPFGNLRGYKGRTKLLEKSTTRLVLKGLELTHESKKSNPASN
ncbi:hypothetical protein ACFL4P_01840 [Gemmatimonadota bacterium]